MRTLHTLILMMGAAGMPTAEAMTTRGKLMADCIIQLIGTKEGRTRLTVMPGSTAAYILTPSTSHLVLDLPVDETYLLTFEHPGCVTKQLYVDATVPIELRGNDFDFPLKVVLERHSIPFTYAGPVGFIFYEHRITDFSYSTDHSISVSEQFAARMSVMKAGGNDPRAARSGYTASTTDPRLGTTEAPTMTPEWGTLAPTVATVAPKVHRLAMNASVAHRPESPPPPPVPLELRPPPVVRASTAAPNVPVKAVVTALPAASTATAVKKGDDSHHASMDPLPVRAPESSPSPAFTYDVVVEPQRITTIIRIHHITQHSTEFRRVVHRFGGVYYFQDGRSISAHSYDQGTLHTRAMADLGLIHQKDIVH